MTEDEMKAEIARLRTIIERLAEGAHYEYCDSMSGCNSVAQHIAVTLGEQPAPERKTDPNEAAAPTEPDGKLTDETK